MGLGEEKRDGTRDISERRRGTFTRPGKGLPDHLRLLNILQSRNYPMSEAGGTQRWPYRVALDRKKTLGKGELQGHLGGSVG